MAVHKFQTKNQVIYQALKKDIISGKFKPGQRIVISEIARLFDSSDIPVREALKHLESDGLIHTTPYVGSVVASLNLDELEEIYQVRSELESLAARLAVPRIGAVEIEELKKQIGFMRQVIDEENFDQLGRLNRRFHQTIYDFCQNTFLLKTIFELWDRTGRAQGVFALMPERAHRSLAEHEEILEALAQGDAERVGRLIKAQKEAVLESMRAYLAEHELEDEMKT